MPKAKIATSDPTRGRVKQAMSNFDKLSQAPKPSVPIRKTAERIRASLDRRGKRKEIGF